MTISRIVLAAAAALAVGAGVSGLLPGVASAQTYERHIEVKRCDPTRQVTQSAPPIGFAPGYYPRSRYYFDDVYGYPYYQAPITVNQTGSLKIDYVNVTKTVMQSIDFGLIANGRLVAEVRDVGTFSPGAEIKHEFGLNPNVFPLGTGLPQCVPLRITYKDQATWVNPHLPSLQRSIYASP